uniref:FlgO family outer membrane protein n=1 Tax=Rheinheimera sp. TaxID=1869214 RepID=UPI0040478F27
MNTKYSAAFFIVLVVTMAGCSHQPVPVAANTVAPALSAKPLHFYTRQLADELFTQLPKGGSFLQPVTNIAIASFVPVNSLSLDQATEAEIQQANQLSEVMLAHAKQYGYSVFDYRLRSAVLLRNNHEQALSRQLADVSSNSKADTLLTGTYSMMQDGMMLNIRLIRIQDTQVLAAVSGYVPDNVLWSRQQVIKRGDKLYRQGDFGGQE